MNNPANGFMVDDHSTDATLHSTETIICKAITPDTTNRYESSSVIKLAATAQNSLFNSY